MPKTLLAFILLAMLFVLPSFGQMVGMANPASAYCVKHKGKSIIQQDNTGAQYGICRFPSGKECEEWAFYRGSCSKK